MTPLKYKGVNSNGATIVGRGKVGQCAADLAREFFDRGWRKLTVTEDEREVGGITRLNGQRNWWGEGER